MISKRYRATALVIKDGKVLLVRDRHRNDYSMPGGGFNSGESTIEAAIREIREELRLRTLSAERLRYCDFEGQRAKHKVCLLEVEGTPHIDRKELSDFLWWDRKSDIKVGHVNKILYEYSKRNYKLVYTTFVRLFANTFRLGLTSQKDKERSDEWEYVGQINYMTTSRTDSIPKWLQSAIADIQTKHGGTSSSLVEKTFYVKGKTFLYKINFAGQGGYIVIVSRRLRRHKHNKNI
jgi:8-oxo-dGTP pyrophosphatase MutT (NUDIX family)